MSAIRVGPGRLSGPLSRGLSTGLGTDRAPVRGYVFGRGPRRSAHGAGVRHRQSIRRRRAQAPGRLLGRPDAILRRRRGPAGARKGCGHRRRTRSAIRRRAWRTSPPGEYFVQALLNVYTRFPRADGHVIWAHMDQWEGQQFNRSPGQPLQRAAEGQPGPGGRLYRQARADQGHPPGRGPGGHRVGQTDQVRKQAPDRLLGAPDRPRRHRAPAQRLRHASGCPLPCGL